MALFAQERVVPASGASIVRIRLDGLEIRGPRQWLSKAERIWAMDRGIATEEVLAEMRASDPPVSCLVGAPKGRCRAAATADERIPRGNQISASKKAGLRGVRR